MSYVEKATLLLEDKSSAKIKKINAELVKLATNAKKTQAALRGIDFRFKGMTETEKTLKRITAEMNRLKSASAIKPKVDTQQITKAESALKRLNLASKLKLGTSTLKVNAGQLKNAEKNLRSFRSLANRPLPTVNVKANSNALARALASLQRLHSKAEKPIAEQVIRVRRVLSDQTGASRRGRAGVETIALDTSRLSGVLSTFISRFKEAAVTAIIDGFQRGAKTQDVAETRLGLNKIDTNQELVNQYLDKSSAERVRANNLSTGELFKIAHEAARRVSSEYPVLNPSQALGIFTEALPVAKGDAAQAEVLTRVTADFVRLRVALGDTTDAAVENAIKISKAGEQSGLILNAAGNIDFAKTKQFFDLVNKGVIQGGKEIDPGLIGHLFKSLRATKFGLDPRGFMTALALAEEMGSTAGVGLNQLRKQLSGKGLKKEALQKLVELGLVTTKEVKTGKVGSKQRTEVVVDKSIDPDLLNRDILGFVDKYVIPALVKQAAERGENLDISNLTAEQTSKLVEGIMKPTNAINAAGELTSDRTATDALISLITRSADLNESINRALSIDTSPEAIRRVMDKSGLVALQEASSQLTGLAGQIASSFEEVLIPALKGVASVARGFSDFIAPDGNPDPSRTALVGAGAVGAGVLGLKAGKTLLDLFNPLNASAAALDGAAVALTAAAAKLSGSKISSDLPGKPDNKPSKLDRLGNILVVGAIAGLGYEVTKEAVDYDLKKGKDSDIRNIAKGVGKNTFELFLDGVDYYENMGKQRNTKVHGHPMVSEVFDKVFSDERLAESDRKGVERSIKRAYQRYGETRSNPLATLAESTMGGSDKFNTTFEVTAEKFGTSIASAGSDLVGKASEFGTTAGAAIAAAILNAVSNIKVNATINNGGENNKSDTGRQSFGHA